MVKRCDSVICANAARGSLRIGVGIRRGQSPGSCAQTGDRIFHNEFLGEHANYRRQVEFAEREVLSRALQGPAAFYGPDGKLRPEVLVHLQLVGEFADDMKRLCARASELKHKREASEGLR